MLLGCDARCRLNRGLRAGLDVLGYGCVVGLGNDFALADSDEDQGCHQDDQNRDKKGDDHGLNVGVAFSLFRSRIASCRLRVTHGRLDAEEAV